jgi:hypothetical protein
MESTTFMVVVGVAVAVMGAMWFGVRFWLASTRPVDIKDVQTPALDRLNRQALERATVVDDAEEEDADVDMGDDEEEGDDPAPEGLTDVVPDEGK